MKISLFFCALVASSLLLFSCHTSKNTAIIPTINLDTVSIRPNEALGIYRASVPMLFDLVHTKLDVSFNWNSEELIGSASITLHPHCYATDSLLLDAKGMDIKSILINEQNKQSALNFTYDSMQLHIGLPHLYSRTDTLRLQIEYVARPKLLHFKSSEAITDARGIYFIKPDSLNPDKPREIWSQGETESASCWFPTLDSPNQRMTQEIRITTDTNFVTLSNGILEFSLINPDGTKTDCWRQSLPAAPYLSMITVGEFETIKDHWRNIDVDYLVEKKYKHVAAKIFGNTPEMLEFFSTRLGVDYPWEKFAQVAVRDFVSGAMENSSAVVHGSFMQRNERQLIDETHEDFIAHELFHQWFGDLVTCESWSNLPLNESFATYGEYLWDEHKYGREEADLRLQQDLKAYLRSTAEDQVEMIRYQYEDKEDMFDDNSYQKGGRILHLLRNAVGDSAFFASLQYYLKSHAFTAVEIHDLRLAFEHVTGQDMHWFFDQWFFHPGHPQLDITYNFNDSLKLEVVTIKQTQDLGVAPLYRLPLAIDIYTSNGTVVRKNSVLSELQQEFKFPLENKPSLVNVDADKILLGTKKDHHTPREWQYMYYHAPLYLDRYEGLTECAKYVQKDSLSARLVVDALNDKQWNIRAEAIQSLTKKIAQTAVLRERLINLASTDPKSRVRLLALEACSKYFGDSTLAALYRKAISDSSYKVAAAALEKMTKTEPIAALQAALVLQNEDVPELYNALGLTYAALGNSEQFSFFTQALDSRKAGERYTFIRHFGNFLLRCDSMHLNEGIERLDKLARTEKAYWLKAAAIKALDSLQTHYSSRVKQLASSSEPSALTARNEAAARSSSLQKQLDAILRDEQDPNVFKQLGIKKRNASETN